MENYVANACLTPFEPLIEDKSLMPGHLQTADSLLKPLPSNDYNSVPTIQYVHSSTNCPDSPFANFQYQLVELNREIELLLEQYNTLNAFVETKAQTVMSGKLQSIISSIIFDTRQPKGKGFAPKTPEKK